MTHESQAYLDNVTVDREDETPVRSRVKNEANRCRRGGERNQAAGPAVAREQSAS
jgi:hypothetical protein